MHQRRSIITKKASFLPSVATNVSGFEQDACLLLAVARVTTIKMKIVPIRPIEQNLSTSRKKREKEKIKNVTFSYPTASETRKLKTSHFHIQLHLKRIIHCMQPRLSQIKET